LPMHLRVARIWACALLMGNVRLAGSADFVGHSKCTNCHEHQRQTTKWKTEEPKSFGKKAHYSALKRLEDPEAAKYAAAVGLSDAFDLRGTRACVKCHATVFRGDAQAGVSCESCHGAASGYLQIHQLPGSYTKSVAAGMRDLKEKPATIASRCAECHSIKDAALVAAGHPSGESFSGDSLRKLVHWDTAYNFAQVAAAYTSAAGKPVKAAATLVETPSVSPRPTRGRTATPPDPKPAKISPAAPQKVEPTDLDTDWLSKPVRPLPRGAYVPPPVTPRPASPVKPVTPPPASKTPVAPVAPVAKPPEPEPETSRPLPASTNARCVQLRSDALALLDRMLKNGVRPSTQKPAIAPAEFKGPDGELYRIQDEALALALEALRNRK